VREIDYWRTDRETFFSALSAFSKCDNATLTQRISTSIRLRWERLNLPFIAAAFSSSRRLRSFSMCFPTVTLMVAAPFAVNSREHKMHVPGGRYLAR